MAGKYGTPMGLVYLKPKKKRKMILAKAGDVTITRADGTVETKPAYPRNAYVPRVTKSRKKKTS